MNTDIDEFTYTRKRWGRGFQYLVLPQLKKVQCNKTIKQIKEIVIPPMWRDVYISLNRQAKIVAVGRDAKGRKQYIYSETWQLQQQTLKFNKLIAFAEALPKMRKLCYQQLKQNEWSSSKVLALMVLILDETGVRIGNKRYSQENQSYGLSTLRRKHIVTESAKDENNDDATVQFEFIGKSGKARQVSIDDAELAQHIKICAQQPGYNIFRYQENANTWHDVCSEEVNEFIKQNMGSEFSCKDFRTWTGTCLALEYYWQTLAQKSRNRKKKLVNVVIEKVAKQLGNTPAICKDYYIHPAILALIEKGDLGQRIAEADQADYNLSDIELFAIELIQQQG